MHIHLNINFNPEEHIMFTYDELREILAGFAIAGRLVDFRTIVNGHINNTIEVIYDVDGKQIKHLLQQINTHAFKDPDRLMANVDYVTSYLRDKVKAAGGDAERETLYCKPTSDGKKYLTDSKGRVWRLYNFVDNAFSYETIESSEVFFNAGKAFGEFQRKLADFPIDRLYDTIPDFHNTAIRYTNLVKSATADVHNRLQFCRADYDFAVERRRETFILTGLCAIGDIPLRVTHNDTKLNNIMFDKETGLPLCVVDLDTVMPGLSLYDFGDAIRYGANTAAEDEKDVSKVSLSLELYEAYVRGFLSGVGNSLTEAEIEYMPLGAKMMTLECGMRFLTDYLDGNIYFKTAYPEHNLVRCRTQFALVADMERKFDQMKEITNKAYKEIVLGE